jgi:hypothetical protein
VELLKRIFASCLAAFSFTLLLLMVVRLIEPIARPDSVFVAVGNLLLFWPTRLHAFGISGCPAADPSDKVRCLGMAFGIDAVTYAILCFPILSILERFKGSTTR